MHYFIAELGSDYGALFLPRKSPCTFHYHATECNFTKMSSNTWCPFFDHFLCTTNLFSVIDFINVYIKLLGDWVSCKQSKSVIPLPNSAIKQSHTDVCSRPFYAQKQFIWYRMPVLRSKMMIYRDCTQSWFQVCCKQWTSGHLNSYNQWTGLVDWTVKLD